jgi:hypothetical protein
MRTFYLKKEVTVSNHKCKENAGSEFRPKVDDGFEANEDELKRRS